MSHSVLIGRGKARPDADKSGSNDHSGGFGSHNMPFDMQSRNSAMFL